MKNDDKILIKNKNVIEKARVKKAKLDKFALCIKNSCRYTSEVLIATRFQQQTCGSSSLRSPFTTLLQGAWKEGVDQKHLNWNKIHSSVCRPFLRFPIGKHVKHDLITIFVKTFIRLRQPSRIFKIF